MAEKRIPSSEHAEAGVLSCLLYNPYSINKVVDTLRPEHFASDNHAEIYRAILDLHARGKQGSFANVIDALDRRDILDRIGGPSELYALGDSRDTLTPVEDHAERVIFTYTMGRLIDAAGQIAGAAYAQDEHALDLAEQLISAIVLQSSSKPVASFSEAIDRYMDNLNDRRRQQKEGKADGTPTGLLDLDRLLGGLRKSRLYTIASRPGYGKTAMALTIAVYIAAHARHALFFSLEMDEDEIVQRALAAETQIDQSFLRDGDIEQEQMARIQAMAQEMRDYDLKIDDRTYLLSEIRAKARAVHARKPLDLIVVDYLQLIDISASGRDKNMSRPEEVARISKDLKKLARELKVPILALAQMNRESERHGNALPQLSDLGESSGIEKDSDCVMFIYCNNEEMERRERNEPYDLSIIVKKHRNGRMGSVPLRFRPKLTKFQDQEGFFHDQADA